MYKKLLIIYDPKYTLFLLPVVMCILLMVIDYVVLSKPVNNTKIEIAHVYSHLKGRPCKVSINVASPWGNEIFETRTVSDSICKSEYTDINITHTVLMKRWLSIESNNKVHYFVDAQILTDALYFLFATFTVYCVISKKEKTFFDYPALVMAGVSIISFIYLYKHVVKPLI